MFSIFADYSTLFSPEMSVLKGGSSLLNPHDIYVTVFIFIMISTALHRKHIELNHHSIYT